MSNELPPLTHMELLVYGRLPHPVIVPASLGHPLELWISQEPAVELFSTMVGRQCGATIQNGRLWLFRPVPLTVESHDGQTVQVNKMIALDGGPLRDEEFLAVRQGGLNVRYLGTHRKVFVVTQGDVVELPPIIPNHVNLQFKTEPTPAPTVEPELKQAVEPESARAAPISEHG